MAGAPVPPAPAVPPAPPTGALRPALAVLAAAGPAFAALVLRPSAGLFAAGHGPLGSIFLAVLLLCAGWPAGVAALRGRYLAAVGRLRHLPPRADRLHELTVRLLPAAAVLVPAALMVSFFAQHTETPAPPGQGHPPQQGLPDLRPRPTLPPVVGSTPHVSHHLGLTGLAMLVVKVLLGVLMLAAAVLVWRHLRRRSLPHPAAGPAPRPAEGQLAEAIESGRRALLGNDARAAVISCYAAMETSLADSGIARQVADSPSDLLARAVAGGSLPEPEATALTDLFREARYSRHPMGTPELDRARTALDAIATHLADPRATDRARPAAAEPTEANP